MRLTVIACAISAAAALLAACSDSNSGPALPPTPEGAQAPSEPASHPPERRVQIRDDQRAGFEQVVRNYLDGAQQRMPAGMRETPEAPEQVVEMQPGRDFRWRVPLTAGVSYIFIGACDDDCTNLDFELIAPQGGVVASDLAPDDFPITRFTPTEDGEYLARLILVECSVAPCFAGARVLSAAPAVPKGQP